MVLLQEQSTAVWLIELTSDTEQELYSPLGMIRPLTLLINAPPLPQISPKQIANDQDLSHGI